MKASPGEASAEAAYRHFESKLAEGHRVPYADLQRLLSFGWLLSSAQSKQVFQWADGMAGVATRPAPPQSKPTSASGKARTASAKSHVASLFKRTGTT